MMKKLKLLWLLPLALAVIFTMCKKDQEEQPRTVEISFSGDVMEPGGLKDGPPYDCMEVDADYAMIQIEGQTYKREVFYLDGKPYTQSIKFDLGTDASLTFTVEAFVLYYDNGTADESDDYPIAATPTVDGEFAEWVDKPLEFDIDVFEFEKIEVPIEVLCVGDADVYDNFGYDWFLVEEIIIREQCFFGDICLKHPDEYANSWYSQQGTMQIDMVAIMKIEVWRDSEYQGDGMEYVTEFSNMDETTWIPGVLCVQYGDYLYYGDDFEFRLFIYVKIGDSFGWVPFKTWTFSDDDVIPEAEGMEDGVVDFVLGTCAPDADYIFPPYMNLPTTCTWNGQGAPNGIDNPGYGDVILTNFNPVGTYDLPEDESMPAYCIDTYHTINFNGTYNNCGVYSSLYPEEMPYGGDKPWNEVNWLQNHLDWYPAATSYDIQQAIWILQGHGGGAIGGLPAATALAQQMATEASSHDTYLPLPGGWAAVALLNGEFVQYTFVIVDP